MSQYNRAGCTHGVELRPYTNYVINKGRGRMHDMRWLNNYWNGVSS